MRDGLAERIREKALLLGYESCGIVPLDMLGEYDAKMRERVQKVPRSDAFYQRQQRLTDPAKAFPWARSVVVVLERYGRYVLPGQVRASIGKHYLFDTRINENTREFKAGVELENLFQSLGLQFANERKFGLVGLRWAALKAGLGTIRRNNFFYTKSSGSWVSLQGWLIDQRLELIGDADLPKCPDNCNRCIKACPSGSLCAPYTMSPTDCVSFLTTNSSRDLLGEPLCKAFGPWIYGCDACQDVCPMNKDRWKEEEDFPGLAELAPSLTPEKIMEMDEAYYQKNIQPKFFYLKGDELWKWKVNALNYMRNSFQESYRPYILTACTNENRKVSEMAEEICREIGGQP